MRRQHQGSAVSPTNATVDCMSEGQGTTFPKPFVLNRVREMRDRAPCRAGLRRLGSPAYWLIGAYRPFLDDVRRRSLPISCATPIGRQPPYVACSSSWRSTKPYEAERQGWSGHEEAFRRPTAPWVSATCAAPDCRSATTRSSASRRPRFGSRRISARRWPAIAGPRPTTLPLTARASRCSARRRRLQARFQLRTFAGHGRCLLRQQPVRHDRPSRRRRAVRW